MKTILRDRFHSPGSYKLDPDPLIRLGALYRLGQQAENAGTKGELLELLDKAINKDLVFSDSDRFLFLLHTAVLLSQNNSFEGVQWILHQIVTAPTQELRSIAVTALRNCTQFPFAVLLTQSIELSESNIFQKGILSLMRTSEDDLYAIAQKSSKEQKQHLLDFTAQIEAIRQSPCTCNSGREIVLGTIVSRPVQKDFGYRYTGFVSMDDMGGPSLVVPYDMADVLNRDDRHARQSVWRLLGQLGHRAIFVFNTEGDQEVQVMYVLPFAVLSGDEMQQLITRLADEAKGLDIGVVVARWSEHNKTRYRLLTKSGRNMVQSYRADEQKIGNCFLIHSLNPKPLSTRYQLQAPFVANIVRHFVQNVEVDLAVHVNSWKNNNLIVTQKGNIMVIRGELPFDYVYVVEESGRDVFQLPGGFWQATDRSKVLQSFFTECPDSFGIIVKIFQHQDGTSHALAIRATSGERKLLRIEQVVQPGTLVYWNTNDKGESYATILADQRIIDGCVHCFSVSYRVCEECDGEGKVICPDCDGTRRIDCPDSNCNDGKTTCGHCGGDGKCSKCEDGRWRNGQECPVCGGSGLCRTCRDTPGFWNCNTCHGRGTVWCDCEYGKVTCEECNGERITPCDCRGRTQGTIVPV